MDFLVGTVAKIDKVNLVRKAEDLGFTHFGVGEGPLLFSEPYEFLALAARETSTINIGTLVTNPLTRIPPQTANAAATLNALAPGRVFCGFGAANNAMRSMGRRTARVKEIEHAVEVIRGLLAGERVVHDWLGQEREIEFLDTESGWYNIADPVPIWMAVGGPKGLAMAARLADVVVYCLGPQPTMIELVRQELDNEIKAAGRDPKDVKLVGLTWFYMLREGEGLEEAITNGIGSAALVSPLTNINFMVEHEEKLGPEVVEASKRATAAYLETPPGGAASTHYLDVWRSYLRGLDPRHKEIITREIVDYWCLWGNPDECLEKAHTMLGAGVDMLAVFLSNPYTAERDMEDMASSIVARV